MIGVELIRIRPHPRNRADAVCNDADIGVASASLGLVGNHGFAFRRDIAYATQVSSRVNTSPSVEVMVHVTVYTPLVSY